MRSRPASPTLHAHCSHYEENGTVGKTIDIYGKTLSRSLSLLQLKPTRVEFSCKEDKGHGEDEGFLSVLGEFLKNELLGQ